MHINEIKTENLVLTVTAGRKTIEIKLKKAEKAPDVGRSVKGAGYIVLNPVYADGKVVSFSRAKTQLQVIEGRDVYIFKSLKLTNLVVRGKTYLIAESDEDAAKTNRRSNYRYYVGEKCMTAVGVTKKKTQCIVKDISESGIAFVYPAAMEGTIMKGQAIYFDYHDSFPLDNRQTNHHVAGMATVCRKEVLQTGKMIVGCTADNRRNKNYLLCRQNYELQQNRIRREMEKGHTR